MLKEPLNITRDLGRLQEIASFLIRHGFGDIVHRLGLGTVLKKVACLFHNKEPQKYSHLTPPERVCQVLEELGPTYIKLGQQLALRVDLLPLEWIEAFEKLQDQVLPLPFEKLRHQIEEDLGAPPEEIFSQLETQPLAAASLAQVHRASLQNGKEVILKIRRPEIKEKVEADLRLLAYASELAEQEIEELKKYRPREIVQQFISSLKREMNFATEAHQSERVAMNFKDNPHIVIPKIYWQWTCERLNAQDHIKGVPGRNLEELEAKGLNRKLLASRGADAVLKMILIDGFFHADPHPGNVFYLEDNRLAFIDFGMVGRLSKTRRLQVVNLLDALVNKDSSRVADILGEWTKDISINSENLSHDIDIFLDNYYGIPLKELNMAEMIRNFIELLQRHHLVLPPDLALLFKVFLTLEGFGRKLDPEFNIMNQAKPFVQQIVISSYSPEKLAKTGLVSLKNILNTLIEFPQDLGHLIKELRQGKITQQIDLPRLRSLGNQLDRAVSRLTVGLVMSALIIASAIIMTAKNLLNIGGYPILALLGFVSSMVCGVWLFFSIWRGGKR